MKTKKKAVIVSCFDWYGKRLKYIANSFRKLGFEVVIISSDFDHVKKKKIKNKNSYIEYIEVPQYKRNLSIKRIYSHCFFARKAYKRLILENPDFVYCLIPPNFLAKYCMKFKKKRNKSKVIFDIIDLWPESFPISKFKNLFVFRIWRNIRQNSILNSDYIVCECKYYQEFLKIDEKYSSVLYIGKDDEGVIKQFESNEEIFLGYLGSLNHLIDIEMICEIVKNINVFKKVNVIIIGVGEKEKEVCHQLEKAGATVIFYGAIYDTEKTKEIFSKCDLALNIYKPHLHIGVTIKSIDYFQFGIPIINNIKFDTEYFVELYGAGVNINNTNVEIKAKEIATLTKEEISKMRKSSRGIFADNFHDKKIEDKIDSILMKISEKV